MVMVGPTSTDVRPAKKQQVKVWPNPLGQGPLYVQIGDNTSRLTAEAAIRVTDAHDRLVYTEVLVADGQYVVAIDLRRLPAGLYSYEVVHNSGKRLGSGRLSILGQ